MKFKINVDQEPIDLSIIVIYIGQERFRMTETEDGKLQIIKYSDGESDLINIRPRTGNKIELF